MPHISGVMQYFPSILVYFPSHNALQVHGVGYLFVFQCMEGEERSVAICPNGLPTYDLAKHFYLSILMQVSRWAPPPVESPPLPP